MVFFWLKHRIRLVWHHYLTTLNPLKNFATRLRHAVLALAKEMVEIVIDEIEGIENYEEIIDRITSRLIDTIRKADNIPQNTPALSSP